MLSLEDKIQVARDDISKPAPWGLKWRSSVWFATFVVGLGITTDMIVYSIIIPIFPFRLEALGYSNVPSLLGWLLLTYWGSFALSTIPIAMLSERYATQRMPLIIGLFALLGSQVMLMEATTYWVMCVARVLQGISSSAVWTSGLALLTDTTPKSQFGRQVGFATMGCSLGLALGTPVGGALYARFGIRAPFLFGGICTILDLFGRILIIERNEALAWGVDPAADRSNQKNKAFEAEAAQSDVEPSDNTQPSTTKTSEKGCTAQVEKNTIESLDVTGKSSKPLSLLSVVVKLCKSSRALVALCAVLTQGITESSRQTVLAVHLQSVWSFDASKVGLVFLAALVPTLIASPLSGWLADTTGTEWTFFVCLLLDIPFWILLNIQSSLPLFVVAFAAESLFGAGQVSTVCVELSAVSRTMEGVGYAHVYGAYNLAYGIGSTVGPLIGGQIYDHLKYGWAVICILAACLVAICVALSFCFIGPDTLLARFQRRLARRANDNKRDSAQTSLN